MKTRTTKIKIIIIATMTMISIIQINNNKTTNTSTTFQRERQNGWVTFKEARHRIMLLKEEWPPHVCLHAGYSPTVLRYPAPKHHSQRRDVFWLLDYLKLYKRALKHSVAQALTFDKAFVESWAFPGVLMWPGGSLAPLLYHEPTKTLKRSRFTSFSVSRNSCLRRMIFLSQT